jgi:C1A family cysteine protease
MNLTKTVLILGVTVIGLLGAMKYLKVENDDMVIEIQDQNLGLRLQLFKEWMQKYNKAYGLSETKMRFAIWNKMYDFIQEHNAKGESWTAGLNQFSDLTGEEFSSIYTGYNWKPNRHRNVKLLDETNLATSVDWVTAGAVTAIKNQGQCGACWSFSTTGALEGLYFINDGTLISFSEQQLIDCSSSYGNQGCNGGLMDDAFKYVEAKGIMRESDYGYLAKSGTCKYNVSKTVFKNTGYTDVKADTPTQLLAAVNKGPVSIAIEADQNVFQSYTSGIINSTSCGTSLDHGVLVVGYNGTSYWIVKNSWGTTWGESGFVKIAYGTQSSGKGICGINSDPSYPTLSS